MSYKLAGEDEHTFQIQHPDGSTFSIAKHAVGPGVHKKIKSMEPVKMADGGIVPDEEMEKSQDFKPTPDDSYLGTKLRDFLGLNTPQSTSTAMATPEEYAQQASIPAPEVQRQPAMDQAPVMPPAAAPNAAPMPASPILQPNQAPQPTQFPDMRSDYAGAYALKEKGIKDIASAQSQASKAQSAAYEEQINQVAKQQAIYQQERSAIDAEHKQLVDAVTQQKIDPNRFYNNMNTGNKVLAAISVALSGLGSGLSGQPNMAMSVIQKSIDRDIESQKMELGKKNTLLSENLRRYGDLNTATQATMLQMNAMTQAKVAQASAAAGDAQSRGQAEMMLSDLKIDAAQRAQQLTMRKMIMDSQNGKSNPENLVSYLRVADPKMAEEMEKRLVPGVGLASVPVTSETRSNLIAKQQLGMMARDLYKWSEKHSGSLDPATVAEGSTKAAELQSLYRNAINGGVFKKGEQEFIDTIVDSDPTKFFNNIRVLPKLKEIIKSNDSQLNVLKKGYGLPTLSAEQQLSPKEQSYLQWARQNPNDPKAAAVFKKLGIQ